MLGDLLHDDPQALLKWGGSLDDQAVRRRFWISSSLKGASRKLPLAARALVNRARFAVSALRLRSLAQNTTSTTWEPTFRLSNDCARQS